MNSNNLHALIVLRNHAQAILNGARADLKLTREDKASLMNGLKKVDEVFIKNFENCVDASNVSTKVRSWTSTESEESVLSRAMGLSVAAAASDESVKAAELATNEVTKPSTSKSGLFSRAHVSMKEEPQVTKALKGLGVEPSTVTEGNPSETVTVPVVTTKNSVDKKAKRGPKRA